MLNCRCYVCNNDKCKCLGRCWLAVYQNALYAACSIGDNWSFDDQIAQEYGCVVRAFDPRLACYGAGSLLS